MTYSNKICVIGNASVGKTSLINQYTRHEFSSTEKATVGANFVPFRYVKETETINIAIWDTAGQEKYRSMVAMYYRGSVGAMIIYDITNKESFTDVSNWLEELRRSEPSVVCILVGNKTDSEHAREVTEEEASTFAKENGLFFVECSAKNDYRLFSFLVFCLKFFLVKFFSNIEVLCKFLFNYFDYNFVRYDSFC